MYYLRALRSNRWPRDVLLPRKPGRLPDEGSQGVASICRTTSQSSRIAGGGRDPPCDIRRPTFRPDEKFIFFAACESAARFVPIDERYRDRFGEMTARALDATPRTHDLPRACRRSGAGARGEGISVSAPAAPPSICARARGRASRSTGKATTPRVSFYACSRLVRLPEVLTHSRCDVFMWDMDTGAVKDLRRLVAAMAADGEAHGKAGGGCRIATTC